MTNRANPDPHFMEEHEQAYRTFLRLIFWGVLIATSVLVLLALLLL